MSSTAPAIDDYEKLTDRALQSDTCRHNLGILKSVTGGTEIALGDPIDFDPREDYWYSP